MKALNLIAKGTEQTRIKDYLEQNASEILASKINNGVHVTVDGKELINKKDLDGFWSFATEEARKQAESNSKGAYVDDATVFGWAIHYFEEDSITGTLYNFDGSKYEQPKPQTKAVQKPVKKEPEKPKDEQLSFFNFNVNEQDDVQEKPVEQEELAIEPDEEPEEACIDNAPNGLPNKEEIEEFELCNQELREVAQKYAKVPDWYRRYNELKISYLDCILFYRLGDFYEVFGDDAVQASELLDLTLTSRDVGLEERVKMAGVPYHAIDSYVSRLIAKKRKVALVENNGEEIVEKDTVTNTKTGEVISKQISSSCPEIEWFVKTFNVKVAQ